MSAHTQPIPARPRIYAATMHGRCVARLTTSTPVDRPGPRPLPKGRWALSEFTYLRWVGHQPVVLTARTDATLEIATEVLPVLWNLAEPHSVTELAARVPQVAPPVIGDVLALLKAGQFIDSNRVREQPGPLQAWSFSDLLLRNSHNSVDAPPADDDPAQPPAVPLLPLARWLPENQGAGGSLARALDRRRSTRVWAAAPLTRAQLGHFLDVVGRAPHHFGLRTAIIANRCGGLPQGIYVHDPAHHALTPLAPWSLAAEKLVDDASRSVNHPGTDVQILIVLFCAAMDAGAYAQTLIGVGRRMQHLYLAASIVGLGACALGAGDSTAFARASGLHPYDHPALGEFLIGSVSKEPSK